MKALVTAKDLLACLAPFTLIEPISTITGSLRSLLYIKFVERKLTSIIGTKYAIAVNSATSALHAACAGLGLGEGDYLWTSPISFVASANCGLYCGAKVDFIDIEMSTYNLDIEKLEKKLFGRTSPKGKKSIRCI